MINESVIKWIMDRGRVKIYVALSVTSDPNRWFDYPRCIVDPVERIVRVSMDAGEIVAGLPGWRVRWEAEWIYDCR